VKICKNLSFSLKFTLLSKKGDFGLAFILSNEDLLKSSKGTYHFMAPETFNEQKIEKGISGKLADIWSLGVTLYAFIFLVLPFYEKNLVTLINSIKGKRLENTKFTSS